ncbi:MAG: hypothetical protein NVSMB57_00470 [Actinomycetota bacterium]
MRELSDLGSRNECNPAADSKYESRDQRVLLIVTPSSDEIDDGPDLVSSRIPHGTPLNADQRDQRIADRAQRK